MENLDSCIESDKADLNNECANPDFFKQTSKDTDKHANIHNAGITKLCIGA